MTADAETPKKVWEVARLERSKRRRASTPRARTIPVHREPKYVRDRHRRLAVIYDGADHELPVDRGDCQGTSRPCPLVGCRYNTYLDVSSSTGSIKVNFPALEPEDVDPATSCALDVADEGPTTLERVGEIFNFSRERARQVEETAGVRFADAAGPRLARELREHLAEIVSSRAGDPYEDAESLGAVSGGRGPTSRRRVSGRRRGRRRRSNWTAGRTRRGRTSSPGCPSTPPWSAPPCPSRGRRTFLRAGRSWRAARHPWRRRAIRTMTTKPEPFRVLVADPPWRFDDELPGPKRGASAHYQTLSFKEIFDFPLPPMLDDSHLFLWRVSSMVEEAYAVCRAWGYEPVAEIVWRKTRGVFEPCGHAGGGFPPKLHFGMGRTVRASHETCIIGRRGRPPIRSHSVRSVFDAPVGRHSAKPGAFFDLVEELTFGPYAELFARARRPGWESYGDELSKKVRAR